MGVPLRQIAVGPALCSALRKLLRDVLRALETFESDQPARAHFVRTRVKRIQSLARLVPRGVAWRKMFLPPCGELKDLFAEFRDASIILALAEKYAPGEAHHLRLVARPDLKRAAYLTEYAEDVLSDYPDWSGLEWEKVADRAVRTYRAARQSWRQATCKNAPDAAFHEWRLRVKRLFYQCEYLACRARLVRLTRRVDRLGETLGQIQDVCMAEDWIKKHLGKIPADLPRRKKVLRRRALQRGKLLLAPKPREFRRMLG